VSGGAWCGLIAACAALGAFLVQTIRRGRLLYEKELSRELKLFGATLVEVRCPRALEPRPFAQFRLASAQLTFGTRHRAYCADRVVSLRLADGTEHEVWARLDFDEDRPSVGLDYMQIEWWPRLSELRKERRGEGMPEMEPRAER
jgi:hypothetical protein